MHSSAIALVLAVLPAALALPSSEHGHGHHHHGGYEAYKSGRVSGAPIVMGTSSAPYNLNNGTLGVASTGSAPLTNTQLVTLHKTQYHTLSLASSPAPSQSVAEAGTSNAGSCGATVTVTDAATVTVTVGGGNPAPIESATESSAPLISSSAAPVVSALASSSEASAPIVQSATAQSSTGTPEGRAPSAVQTYNSVASSAPVQTSQPAVSEVTPLATSSAAPVNSATSTPAASASGTSSPIVASGVASADYCKDTLVPTQTPAYVYTGQNYTGGVKGKKRGLVFVAGIAESDALVQWAIANKDSIHWLGNYFSAAPKGLDKPNPPVEFVPQMYGQQSEGNEWNTNAQRAYDAGEKNMLSFGEPGTPNPKNYNTASNYAQTYMSQMQPWAEKGISIASPGQLGAPQDLEWETEFLCKCQQLGCDITYQAGHWFDAAAPLQQQVARAKGTIESYIAIAKGRPVWFDNIWPKGTAAEQKAFMAELVPWLEDNPAIVRYGWVPMDGTPQYGDPFTSGGNPTDLANYFASL
ncbi:hypothetical protein ACLMJK_004271 [Lecanora helva]